jgi:hypothetical protein
MSAAIVRNALLVSLVVTSTFACRGESGGEAAGEPAPAEAATGDVEAGGPAGEVLAISGPGGLESPSLPAGTFLGKGGQLEGGQTVETPRGTLAELQLRGGVRVRLNESTEVKLPTAVSDPLVVTRGEAVVLAPRTEGDEAMRVTAGEDSLSLSSGAELQVKNSGSARTYAVVSGRATLTTPSRTLELGAGERIEAPLPADAPKVEPKASLAALEETSWSRSFEAAARMAEAVPRGVGSLTARAPGSSKEEQRLRLIDQSVTVNITGRIAHTEIEQAFFNDRAAVLEGIYRFPLPAEGSVSGLSLLVGDRWMDGEIVEKERARDIFRQIVDATIPRDPALLEWEQGNIFKLRVFPIPGRGDRKIRLSYTQILPVVGDKLRYRFPMGGSGAGGTEIEKFAFTVNVDRSELDETQVAAIATPMLELDRKTEGELVTLSTEVDRFVPSFDLGVDVPLSSTVQRVQTATHLDKDGQAYFMASLRPDWEMAAPEGPTHYAFVLDRSHSTTPELWTLARGIVEAMAGTMDKDDRFVLLACDTACDEMSGGPRPADAAAVADVQQFLDAQDLAGASDLGGMLDEAARALGAEPSAAERVIVYLGDGAPSSGELAADKLAKLMRAPLEGHRVMAVALGARSDLTALGAVVQTTGGDLLRADPRDDVGQLVREIQLRAQVPVAREIELDLPDGMTSVRTLDTAGLREGDSVILLGKLRHPVEGDVVVRARGPRGPIEAKFSVALTADRASPVSHRHLPRTWAAQQIQHLTQTRGFDAKAEIIALSEDYTVMSRFTSLLVLENDAMFREFNVVRAAKDTDRWTGELPGPTETAATGKASEETPPSEDPATSSDKRTSATTSTPLAGALPAEPEPEAGEKQRERRKDDGGDFKNEKRAFDDDLGTGAGNSPFAEPPPPPGSPAAGPSFAEDEGGGGAGDVPEPDVAFDDEDDVSPALGATGTKSGGASERPVAPPASKPAKSEEHFDAPRDEPAKAKKKPSSSSTSLPGGWGGGGFGRRHLVRSLALQTLASADAKALAKVEEARRAVEADPTRRSAHGVLVRAAIRAGHKDAIELARAWAEVDPDHAPALLSLADMLAADGDPMALRAYESAVEIRPFDRERHASLARAFASKGDHRRACSHARAVVSIDPSRGSHHAELVRCLQRAGRERDAETALTDGLSRSTTDTKALSLASTELRAGRVPAVGSLPKSAQLEATLTWFGEDDLDIVVVDAKGQRLSAMRPESGLAVTEGRGVEQIALPKVRKSVFIEVTRAGVPVDDSRRSTPISGELRLKVAGGRTKVVPVELQGGSLRVAKAFWTTRSVGF